MAVRRAAGGRQLGDTMGSQEETGRASAEYKRSSWSTNIAPVLRADQDHEALQLDRLCQIDTVADCTEWDHRIEIGRRGPGYEDAIRPQRCRSR
jgi:hypothetical protein